MSHNKLIPIQFAYGRWHTNQSNGELQCEGKNSETIQEVYCFVQKRIFSGKLSALLCRADNSLNIKSICNILRKKGLLMHVCCMQQNF